jgi:RNA polymerase-binding transcription factor DksA
MALQAAGRLALRDVEAALRRIRHGTYGRCSTCGEAVSAERLRAVPMISRCGRCQRATAMAATESNAPSGGGHPIATTLIGERHHDHGAGA